MSPVFIDRKCPECDGKGHRGHGAMRWICPTCNGMGSIGESREATPDEMKPYQLTEFGAWMQKARIHVETTYSRLAELTGIAPSRLSEIERGKGDPATEDEKSAIRAHLHGVAIDMRDAEALRLETLRGAAEDMLAALKVAEKYISAAEERGSPSENTLSVIRAAIRKAEGVE